MPVEDLLEKSLDELVKFRKNLISFLVERFTKDNAMRVIKGKDSKGKQFTKNVHIASTSTFDVTNYILATILDPRIKLKVFDGASQQPRLFKHI